MNLKQLIDGEPCHPDFDVFDSYLGNKLITKEAFHFLTHVCNCDNCYDVLCAISLVERLKGNPDSYATVPPKISSIIIAYINSKPNA